MNPFDGIVSYSEIEGLISAHGVDVWAEHASRCPMCFDSLKYQLTTNKVKLTPEIVSALLPTQRQEVYGAAIMGMVNRMPV